MEGHRAALPPCVGIISLARRARNCIVGGCAVNTNDAIKRLYDDTKAQALASGNGNVVAHTIAIEVCKRAFPGVDVVKALGIKTVKA